MRTTLSLSLALLLSWRAQAQNCTNLICNGSFDTPSLNITVALVNSINCWSTTASDGKMEIWASGFNNVPSFGGPHHVELNATEAATMYQDFSVGSGVGLTVSFAHRGRAGTDSMEVSIGPSGGPYTSLGRWGDGAGSWGYYATAYTTTSSGVHRILFTPVYWSGNNVAIGNFLDSVSVVAPATISVTANSPTSCAGSTVQLTASGAAGYTWTGGPTGPSYVVSPTVTTTYTVLGSQGSCNSMASITLTVIPAPPVKVVASKTLVCYGATPALLTASGGTSYLWSSGATSSTINSSAALGFHNYTVTGKGQGGCAATATIQVRVTICEDVEDRTLSAAMRVFPNPAAGAVRVTLASAATLDVYDRQGRRVRRYILPEGGDHELSLSGLGQGIYLLLAVQENGAVHAGRLVVGDQ